MLRSCERSSHGRYRAAMASKEDSRQNATKMIKRLRIHHNHPVQTSVNCGFWDSSCSAVNSGSQHLTAVTFSPDFSHCVGIDAPGARTTISRSSPLLSPARISTPSDSQITACRNYVDVPGNPSRNPKNISKFSNSCGAGRDHR